MTYFGENEQFTEEIAGSMQKQMLADLTQGVKEEYHSAPGLAMLFDRSGGKLNEQMMDVLSKVRSHTFVFLMCCVFNTVDND